MRLRLAAVIFAWGCADSSAPLPKTPSSPRSDPGAPSLAPSPSSGPKTGSSDGMTCDEARDQNVEEIDMQRQSGPDLTANDYAAVLNNGGYLGACEVPEASKIQICVAVRAGAAVGVTVALDPANPDVELCVAKQVRALSFPSHPKMDIAVVRF